MKLEKLSAVEIGKLVNSKLISPVDVIKYFENYISKHDLMNAFVYTKFDEAIVEAQQQEAKLMKGEYVGPFAGVPIGLKDFLPCKKGWPASHGGVKSYQTIDQEDDIFYSTARNLGAIAVGKTNAPSFGFRATTDNKMYGPTSTPFKLGYNSGGSSGGSAAAVGGLLVPLAVCGDAGGSTRVPSAWCNCFGMKPSAGLVPSVCRPDAWTATHPYCCGGYATRTVADSALLMSAAMKYDPRDPISIPYNNEISNIADSNIGDLKIGVTLDFNLFPHPDDEIANAIYQVADILRSNNCTVDDVQFHFTDSLEAIEWAWLLGISIDTGIEFSLKEKSTGHDLLAEHAEDFPEEMIYWTRLAQQANMLDYYTFHNIRTNILDAHLDVFEDYDIILAPVTGCLPVKNATDRNTTGPDSISGCKINPLIGFAYTYLENMIGFPAASVPIGLSKEGLPIGLQVIGRRYQDKNVYRVAYALEKLNPWYQWYEVAENGLSKQC